MALSNSMVQRLKYETGFNLLTIGSEPYIQHVAVWDQVIQDNVDTQAATTSSTTVTAATSPTVVTLTVGSTTGFVAGDTVIVDVDAQRERATVRNVASGTTFSVLLSKAHTGTYPVKLESGETIVLDIAEKLDSVASQIESAVSTAGLKSVDEITFQTVSASGAKSQLDSLRQMRDYWRNELCSALGIVNGWTARRSGGAYLELY
jgi:hypothetical protein